MIFTIEKGCLVCGGDVKGNKRAQYYCKKCNMLFSHDSIVQAGRYKIKRTEAKPMKKVKVRLMGSIKSNKYHAFDCRIVKNINSKNRIRFVDEKNAKKQGYKACKVCSE